MNQKLKKLITFVSIAITIISQFTPVAFAAGTKKTGEEYYAEAQALFEQGKYEEAITVLDKAIALNSQMMNIMY